MKPVHFHYSTTHIRNLTFLCEAGSNVTLYILVLYLNIHYLSLKNSCNKSYLRISLKRDVDKLYLENFKTLLRVLKEKIHTKLLHNIGKINTESILTIIKIRHKLIQHYFLMCT